MPGAIGRGAQVLSPGGDRSIAGHGQLKLTRRNVQVKAAKTKIQTKRDKHSRNITVIMYESSKVR
jgi:hypothetical protein